MKKFWLLLFLIPAVLGLPPLPAFAAARKPAAPSCPVMPGERVKPQFYVDINGERVYVCCRSCVKALKKHPERYLKIAPGADPAGANRVSAKRIDGVLN